MLKAKGLIYIIVALLLFLVEPNTALFAQNFSPGLSKRAAQTMDRIQIASNLQSTHFSSLRNYTAGDYITFLNSLSEEDRLKYARNVSFLETEFRLWMPDILSNRKADKRFLKTIYKEPQALFFFENADLSFEIKPILNIGVGRDSNDEFVNMINQRGLQLNGAIDNKVYFHSTILESQARFTSNIRNIRQTTGFLPGAGFVKTYNSSVFDFNNGVDFLLSQAHLGFKLSKHIDFVFGHGRNFIGNGYRSLLLSDRATDYFYAKVNWRIWKFHLQNIFGELVESTNRGSSFQVLPKKYMAAHYFGFKPFKNMSLGLFEAVIFSRDTGFEFQYLNPVILYRTVEGMIGSPDNVLIGLDGSWNLPKRVQFYGQLILDEFILRELVLDDQGSWTNKWGVQLGMKHINVLGINGLDMQYEYNTIRPYTYSHAELKNIYGHYGQPLAHPLGANFREQILTFRYQIGSKFNLNAKYLYYQKGYDSDAESYGGDIFKSYTLRYADDGHTIAQGMLSKVNLFSADLSYECYHNLFLELNLLWRQEAFSDENLPAPEDVFYIGGGIRYNIDSYQNDL